MCFGSESQQEFEHLGECRTREDVRRLFERYRAEARLYAEMTGEHEPMIVPDVETADEPLVTAR